MTTTNSSTEERPCRLERADEHLATKAGAAEVKADVVELKAAIAKLEAKIETRIDEFQAVMEQRFASQTRWFVGFMLSGMAFMTVVAFGIGRLVQ